MLRWQMDSQEVTFASAGHEPMLVIQEQKLHSFEAAGLPLGVDTTLDWQTETIQLHPGDRFILLTDGISEATNEGDEMFGHTRIQQPAINNGYTCVAEFARKLAEQGNAHTGDQPPQDDITLLVAQCQTHEP